MLRENHINAIVSLTDAYWVWWNGPTRRAGVPASRHKWVQCADSSTQDLLVYMSDICDFIDEMASSQYPDSPVRSHDIESDFSGDSADDRIKREDALALVQLKQRVKPSANFTRQLEIWEQVGYQIWEGEDKTVPKQPYQAYLNDRAALLKSKGLTWDEPLAPLSLLDQSFSHFHVLLIESGGKWP
ncbi:hypothetical protein BJX99DRAFT_262194 [Aspergillus californicus]